MQSHELVLVLISAALHAVWGGVIKRSEDPLLFNWLQMLPTLPLAAAVIAFEPQLLQQPAGFWAWAAAAVLFHAGYMAALGQALARADLSFVYPIARSTPAFLPFAAYFLLDEELRLGGAFGVAIVVVGMALVHSSVDLKRGGPAFPRWRHPGAAFAYLTLASTVAYGITDKAAMELLHARDWHAETPRAVFYFLITGVGSAVLLTPLLWSRGAQARRAIPATARAQAGAIFSALALSLLGYSLILEALRTAPASYVVAARQTSVLFAVILGAIWLREEPNRLRFWGALTIVLGVILLAVAGCSGVSQ